MEDAQNRVVSIATFRATRAADRSTGTVHRGAAAGLSQRSIEHRERMLRFLRMEAVERIDARKEARKPARLDAGEAQGRLLL